MKAILLLKENAEADKSIFFDWPPLMIAEGDAKIGCTCDRWGHPCPNCRGDNPSAQLTAPTSVRKRGKKRRNI